MTNFLCTKTGVTLRVCKNGNVYKKGSWKKMTHWFDDVGYPYIQIKYQGVRCNHRIHRLLALLYLPNPKNLPFVNHLDTNKRNFKLKNLEWSSVSENTKHAVDNGCMDHIKKRGQDHVAAKYSNAQIVILRQTHQLTKRSFRGLAKDFNMSPSYVADIINMKKRVDA